VALRLLAKLLGARGLYPTNTTEATSPHSTFTMAGLSQDLAFKSLREIASDNRSGAAEILQKAAGVLSALDSGVTYEQVCDLCISLVQAQPSMAPVLNFASRVIEELEARPAQESGRLASFVADNFAAEIGEATQKVSFHAALLIQEGSTILSTSRSSTVVQTLDRAKKLGRSFSIVATESRPALEGRTLCEQLSAKSIPAILIADAAACLLMDRVDLVLIGADRITPRFATNKIGTHAIAMMAHSRDIPCYVLGDSSKFLPFDSGVSEPLRSPDEIWPGAPPLVTVVNRYFEPTPLELFSGLVTEDGVVEIEDARRIAASRSLHPIVIGALDEAPR
jgi:translation initiation factor eIF-2B subunit delta